MTQPSDTIYVPPMTRGEVESLLATRRGDEQLIAAQDKLRFALTQNCRFASSTAFPEARGLFGLERISALLDENRQAAAEQVAYRTANLLRKKLDQYVESGLSAEVRERLRSRFFAAIDERVRARQLEVDPVGAGIPTPTLHASDVHAAIDSLLRSLTNESQQPDQDEGETVPGDPQNVAYNLPQWLRIYADWMASGDSIGDTNRQLMAISLRAAAGLLDDLPQFASTPDAREKLLAEIATLRQIYTGAEESEQARIHRFAFDLAARLESLLGHFASTQPTPEPESQQHPVEETERIRRRAYAEVVGRLRGYAAEADDTWAHYYGAIASELEQEFAAQPNQEAH